MKKYTILILALFLFTQCAQNQKSLQATAIDIKSEDYVAIESVIQNYFDGWLTGDTTLLGSAMHSSCNLKFVKDGEITTRTKTEYLGYFKPTSST